MRSSQGRSRSGCSRTSDSSSGTTSAGAAELDVGRDPLLDRDEPELVEPPRLGLRPVLEGELGERRAAPEVERAHEERAALLR